MYARPLTVVLVVLCHATLALASWPLGFYGIIEKVVFEPDQAHARRIQVWGAFVYTRPDRVATGTELGRPERGYLYFAVPDGADAAEARAIRREWADLHAVGGTREAVGFGVWKGAGGYTTGTGRGNALLVPKPVGGQPSTLGVRRAADAPGHPAPYVTNVGVVRLSADGSHAAIVRQLRDALRP